MQLNASRRTLMTTNPMAEAAPPDEAVAELDRFLGDRVLFDLDEPKRFGGPSVPTLYRWKKLRLIEFTKSGGRTKLNRETMKRVLGGVALA